MIGSGSGARLALAPEPDPNLRDAALLLWFTLAFSKSCYLNEVS